MPTILYVEDNRGQCEGITKCLEQHGHKVIPVADGETAIATFSKHREEIDIVITDLGLPDFDGKEVTKSIRATESEVPIVIYSGDYNRPNFDPNADAQAAGANAGVKKGICTSEDLLAAIDTLVPSSQS